MAVFAVPWVDGRGILDDHFWHLDLLDVEDLALSASAMRVMNMGHTLEAHDGLGLVTLVEPVDGGCWVRVLELLEAGEHLQKFFKFINYKLIASYCL